MLERFLGFWRRFNRAGRTAALARQAAGLGSFEVDGTCEEQRHGSLDLRSERPSREKLCSTCSAEAFEKPSRTAGL